MMSHCDPIPTPDLPETFWAYLAAYIDGEGSVAMCQNGPRLIISNTHLDTLEWIRTNLGAGYLGKLKQHSNATKPCYNLTFGSNAQRMILPKVIPYMHEKRERAEIMLEYLGTVVPRGGTGHVNYGDLRQQVKERMSQGNARGV